MSAGTYGCPACGGVDRIYTTTRGFAGRDENQASCPCGWRGRAWQLTGRAPGPPAVSESGNTIPGERWVMDGTEHVRGGVECGCAATRDTSAIQECVDGCDGLVHVQWVYGGYATRCEKCGAR